MSDARERDAAAPQSIAEPGRRPRRLRAGARAATVIAFPLSLYGRIAGGLAVSRAQLQPPLRDLDEIFDAAPPAAVRFTPYVIMAVMAVTITVASLVKVDIIVTAGGKLAADAPPIVLQPMQLAAIRSLRVRAGDVVHKGDELATLDATLTEADQSVLVSQRDGLRAEIERLEAEIGERAPAFSGRNQDSVLQWTLYGQRQSQYAGRLRAFDEDIARLHESLAESTANAASLGQQLGIHKQLEDMHGKLFNKQIETRSTFMDATLLRLRTERDKREAEGRLGEQRHGLAAREADRQVFIDQWRAQLLDDLVKARKEMAGVTESLVKADHLNAMVVLRAPADGVVLEVAKRSVGSVLQAAEPLITLLPTAAPLIAEVSIASGDVGYVKPGDAVLIKVDTFPFERFGTLHGRLRAVAEQSLGGGTAAASGQAPGGLTHLSQVEIDNPVLRDGDTPVRLIPGMSLSAEVKAGSRSVISYFLEPVTRGLHESIREP
ncbi:HlyD family type I secretion periplasmic adaptor subunit [Lichenihabitans sp. Uapishka_5]|uniref:HlyD family type I secretion periplasmic adaptor subunit n=1 Tax=Lichenihabitans sp. Uapishka_5 TaxID=3037302 RepID=UPI0029E7E6E8|nr:HlyD family type I secretion periplasmic adaptor subunit [Lichenihabitans sp. Uapishka_5]MDX7952118.1 HlyD family type I secretion periplasmic adaptor subunit [Lichenihabitans sp. Uapishka_5]